MIHKDYSSANPIQISVYEDWLMIYNNGDLPDGWTMETLKQKHTSQPANPDIAKVFFRAGYIETWGRGTVNLVKYCTDVGLPEPTFEGKWGGVAVIFTKQKDARPWETTDGSTKEVLEETVEKTVEKILNEIKLNPKTTMKELEKLTSLSRRGVEWNINKLKQQGKLKRIGPDKGGYWKIIDKE